MTEAGADVLVPHMGLTTGGAIGASTAKTLDESVELVQAMCDAAKAVRDDVIVLCHGGPIAEPDDAAYVLERTTGVVGFFGASSMERLPTEVAMTENMKRFKAIDRRCAMSRFVMGSEVPIETFEWGSAGMRCAPPGTGCQSFVVMDVRLDPGFFHAFHKHPDQDEMITIVVGQGHAVPRGREHRCSARATRSTSTRTSCTARTTTSTSRRMLAVVLAPAVGDGGYVAVDVSTEEPWASLR